MGEKGGIGCVHMSVGGWVELGEDSLEVSGHVGLFACLYVRRCVSMCVCPLL